MYSTCLFCHASLGRNTLIETFPVGRRLAFDAATGRLWVVCRKCERWNLTPIEERWEAIEECGREYRITAKRTSTDEIGLGRLREGTDLIRIGKPLRPEFASWRYGQTIRRRATTMLAGAGIGAIAFGSIFVGAPVFLAPLLVLTPGLPLMLSRHREVRAGRRYLLTRASLIAGRKVWDEKQVEIRIVPSEDAQGWALRFYGFTLPVDITGSDALQTVNKVMPAINIMGGFWSNVRSAVEEIETAGTPDLYFKRVISYARSNRMSYTPLQTFPASIRLAVEMASQEETERRALVEGELKQLEADWREAEEIAAIADDLFLPKEVTEFIERTREPSV